jgi:hypothetical protein
VEQALFTHGLFGSYEVVLTDSGGKAVLEQYGDTLDAEGARKALSRLFQAEVEIELVPYGRLVDHRAVRLKKPILRLADRRAASEQHIPLHL